MNKKLLAVAVAGTFLAPAAALAQSSVTISGKVHSTFGQFSMSNRAVGSVGRNSEAVVRDESSRIVFSMREDLGGGLAAIGKFDLRFGVSDTGLGGNTGESFVGLTSPAWGTIAMGRFDFHYGNHGSFTGTHAGLLTNPTSIIDKAGAGTVTIANQTRTNNAIRYGSPKFADMFEVVVGYSANPTGAVNIPAVTASAAGAVTTTVANQNENDLRSTVRKGSAWNVVPKLYGKNWEVAYSYWTAKNDPVAGAATVAKHRGDSLYGWYMWGGLRAGLAFNKSKVDTTTLATGVTGTTTNRNAWGIPISYNWGNHTIYGDFYQARRDKIIAGDTKARLFGVTYAYDMSKRTSVALSYTQIRNGAAAAYGLFAQQQATAAGEDPRFLAVSLQHRY